MATLADGYAMASDSAFQQRVGAAAAQNAYNIIALEEDTEPNHATRYEIAQRVANSPDMYMRPFSFMVAANPTIGQQAPDGDNVPDGDIQFAVNAVWLAFAPILPPTPTSAVEPAA